MYARRVAADLGLSGVYPPQVRSQLAAFGESMEKDSAAQRGEVATLVQSAAERGKEFIDDTLQLSNVQASYSSLFEAFAAEILSSVHGCASVASTPHQPALQARRKSLGAFSPSQHGECEKAHTRPFLAMTLPRRPSPRTCSGQAATSPSCRWRASSRAP